MADNALWSASGSRESVFTCIVSRDGIEVFRTEFDRKLEVGRQADGEPAPCRVFDRGESLRLICAPLSELEFSRRQFVVEPLADGRLRVTNLGGVCPLQLSNGTMLRSSESQVFGGTVSFQVGRCGFLVTDAPPPLVEPSEPGSVTEWLRTIRQGDDSAATRGLWNRYFHRLEALARQRLARSSVRVVDGEDVAVDVFHRLCRGVAQGRFDGLQNRDDLWRLLVVLTKQKVVDEVRHHGARKRGGAAVRGDSAFGDPDEGFGLDDCFGSDPTPDDMVGISEQYDRLMTRLPDDESRLVVHLRLEGYANQEIADCLDIGLRSVERKLARARELLAEVAG
jgi:RNA polymerase sigma factor (sigma-70 family)